MVPLWSCSTVKWKTALTLLLWLTLWYFIDWRNVNALSHNHCTWSWIDPISGNINIQRCITIFFFFYNVVTAFFCFCTVTYVHTQIIRSNTGVHLSHVYGYTMSLRSIFPSVLTPSHCVGPSVYQSCQESFSVEDGDMSTSIFPLLYTCTPARFEGKYCAPLHLFYSFSF